MIDFQKNVIHRSNEGIVIVQMTLENCGPCRMIKPVLKEACKKKDIPFILVDIDVQPEIGQTYNVRSVPHILAFHKGQVISKYDRISPIPIWIDKMLNTHS